MNMAVEPGASCVLRWGMTPLSVTLHLDWFLKCREQVPKKIRLRRMPALKCFS